MKKAQFSDILFERAHYVIPGSKAVVRYVDCSATTEDAECAHIINVYPFNMATGLCGDSYVEKSFASLDEAIAYLEANYSDENIRFDDDAEVA
jgi:hypothetical protein